MESRDLTPRSHDVVTPRFSAACGFGDPECTGGDDCCACGGETGLSIHRPLRLGGCHDPEPGGPLFRDRSDFLMESRDLTPRSHDVVTSPQSADLHAVPAHHRPPAIEWRDGVPYHYTVGQPSVPQITVQLPESATLSPWLRELIVITIVMLTVLVVCTGCIVAVVVLCGGTLMGIIGAVSAAALPVTVGVVASLAVFGWMATKVRALARDRDETGGTK